MSTDDPNELDVSPVSDEQLELTDLLNTALDKGVVVHGDVTLAVADIDLVKLNVGLLLSALETIEANDARARHAQQPSLANVFGPPRFDRVREQSSQPAEADVSGGSPPGRALRSLSSVGGTPTADTTPAAGQAAPNPSQQPQDASLNAVARGLPERINADAPGVESGLARLVLTLIEVLRKVLEHQAIRRMDGGKLNHAEVEQLGLALSRLNDRMQELKRVFGLSDEDLQIDLGPLGRLR